MVLSVGKDLEVHGIVVGKDPIEVDEGILNKMGDLELKSTNEKFLSKIVVIARLLLDTIC